MDERLLRHQFVPKTSDEMLLSFKTEESVNISIYF